MIIEIRLSYINCQIKACYANGNNTVCSAAQENCNNGILGPLSGVFDVSDFLSLTFTSHLISTPRNSGVFRAGN